MIVSWKFGPRASANPWRAKTIEWQVSSPPPLFNFDEIPRVVGGPYEFGVPGARHAIMAGDEEGAEVKQTRAGEGRRRGGIGPRIRHDRGRDRHAADGHLRGPRARRRRRPRLPERGRRRPPASRDRPRPRRARRHVGHARRAAEPARGRPDRRPGRGPRGRALPRRGHPGGARRLRHRGRRRGLRPQPAAGARRRRPRDQPAGDPDLVPVRDPHRVPAPRPGRVGQGPLRGAGVAHPGARRRRRRPLGRHPHARRRHPDRELAGAPRTACASGRRRSRTATPSSALAPARSPARTSATASPRPSPSSTARRSTPPASR